MRPISRSFSVISALGFAACASSGSPMAEPAPTPAAVATAPAPAAAAAPGALFSAVQATRGRDQFRSTCTECHTANEFGDASFQLKWSRRSVGDLFEFILTNMPDDAPGILSPNQAVDLVTFILDMNGFEAGSRQMQPDQAALDAISLAAIRSE